MPRITKDNPLTNYISRAEVSNLNDEQKAQRRRMTQVKRGMGAGVPNFIRVGPATKLTI